MAAEPIQPDSLLTQVMKLTGDVGGLVADVKAVVDEISGARDQLERGADAMASMQLQIAETDNRIVEMDQRINGRITKAQQTADSANSRATEALRQVHALAAVTQLWHRLKHSKLALTFALPIAAAAGGFFAAKFF